MVTKENHPMPDFGKIATQMKEAVQNFIAEMQKPPKNKPAYRSTLKKKQQRW